MAAPLESDIKVRFPPPAVTLVLVPLRVISEVLDTEKIPLCITLFDPPLNVTLLNGVVPPFKCWVGAPLNKAVRYAADSITRRGTQKAYATEAEFEVFCRAHV